MNTNSKLVITGATASGKTALAIELAGEIDGEIICADSRTVYSGLDIVSAKPTADERAKVRHHLLDIVEPDGEFSAADFANKANAAADDIISRGKKVIIAGGTWFYIKTFLNENAMPDVGADKKLREELNKKTSDELWQMLFELDKKRAEVVHKNNRDKVIRSIEMCRGLMGPVSEYKSDKNPTVAKWFMPEISRGDLYERINLRVDKMIEEGLFEEWQKNRARWPNSAVLRNTIGYREFFELEEGVWKNFDEAVEKIKQRTRNFAKRQLTYFRSRNDITEVKNVCEIIKNR